MNWYLSRNYANSNWLVLPQFVQHFVIARQAASAYAAGGDAPAEEAKAEEGAAKEGEHQAEEGEAAPADVVVRQKPQGFLPMGAIYIVIFLGGAALIVVSQTRPTDAYYWGCGMVM